MTLTLTCGNLMLMTLISSDTNKRGPAAAAARSDIDTDSDTDPVPSTPPALPQLLRTLNTILVDRLASDIFMSSS